MNIEELLPRVQQIELEILSIFDEFCKKNYLKYTLAYGTLLGAVRHKGFIPWDDDIDVWMPREDYERFIKLWINDPVDGFIIQNTDIESDFNQCFTKLRKDNTTFFQPGDKGYNFHKGIFIDIFPLDRVANSAISFKIQKLYAIFMMLFSRKFVPPKASKPVALVSKMLLTLIPKSKYDSVRIWMKKRMIKKSGKNTGFRSFCTMAAIATESYSTNMFDTLLDIQFENQVFSITSIWDEVLRKEYSNYMQLPPVEQRTWMHHPMIVSFEKNFEDLHDNQ